jgi:hypothetical protein
VPGTDLGILGVSVKPWGLKFLWTEWDEPGVTWPCRGPEDPRGGGEVTSCPWLLSSPSTPFSLGFQIFKSHKISSKKKIPPSFHP